MKLSVLSLEFKLECAQMIVDKGYSYRYKNEAINAVLPPNR